MSTAADASLAWASFPCQDLSLAGERRGLNAPRSGAFWGFWNIIEKLGPRAPRTLAIENVAGLLSSHGGRDFAMLVTQLADAGYRGYVVLEYEGKEDPNIAVPKHIEALKKIIRG